MTIADVATPDDSTLTATLTIGAGATPSTTEARLLIVTTESGQTTPEFFVVPAGPGPTITGIEPGAGSPGDTVQATLRGLHLTNGVVSAAAPLTIGTQTVVDDETITTQVSIDSGATVNTNQTLTVTTGVGTPASATFRVILAGAPFLGEVRPPFGNRGSTFTMLAIGVNLSQVVAGTGVDVLDSPTRSTSRTRPPSTTGPCARRSPSIPRPTSAAGT